MKEARVRVLRDYDDGETYANVGDLAKWFRTRGPRWRKTAERIAEMADSEDAQGPGLLIRHPDDPRVKDALERRPPETRLPGYAQSPE